MAGGHFFPISKAAIDPDGQFAAATSGPGPVQIWSLPDGRLLRTLNIVPYAKAISVSNDGELLAVANIPHNRIELWLVSNWTLQRTIPIPNYAYDMVFSSDDQYLVVGHGDGIRFWRVADGGLWKHIATGFGESLTCIAISPDGAYVATSSSWGGAGQFSLWRVSDGMRTNLVPPEGSQYAGKAVAFSHDGALLGTQSWEFNHVSKVRLWTVPDGQLHKTLTSYYDAGIDNWFAFSDDDQQILSAGGRMARWDIATGSLLNPIVQLTGAARWVGYIPDGSVITAGTEVRLHRGSDLGLIKRFTGHRSTVYSVSVTDSGTDVVSGDSGGENGLPSEIKMWSSHDGSVVRTLSPANTWGNAVYAAVVSPNGETMVTGDASGNIEVWNMLSGTRRYTISGAHGLCVYTVAMSPSGDIFATGGRSDRLKVWRLSDGALLSDRYVGPYIYDLEFSPNGQVLASAGPPMIWDTSTWGLIRTLPSVGSVRGISFSPDGSTLVCATDDEWGGNNGLESWHVATGTLLARTRTGRAAHDVAVSPDGQTAVSAHGSVDYSVRTWGSRNNYSEIKIWRMLDLSVLRTYDQETGIGPPLAVDYTPDGRFFAYARWDGTVVMARNPYPPVGEVTGTVIADGAPLSGVSVSVSAIGGYTDAFVTGTDGLYEFSAVPAGPATVAIETPSGYEIVTPPGGSADVTVAAGVPVVQDFILTGVGTISGIVSEDGGPMAGVTISVAGQGGYTASVLSDGGGFYEFLGVPSGMATVSAVAPSGYEVIDPVGGSAVIQVNPGQATAQDFTLAHLVATVGGIVVADCPVPGTPVADVAVEVREAATNDLAGTGNTGPDGHYTITELGAGAYVISITVPGGYNLEVNHVPLTLEWGEAGTVDFALECQQPPVVTVNLPDVTIDEGQSVANTGTVNDPDGDPVTLSASVGTVTNHGDGTWSWSYLAVDGPAASQTVTITGDDGRGGVASITFELVVTNVAPVVAWIDVPVEPMDINAQPVSTTAAFSDPAGAADAPYTCLFDYGDGSEPLAGTISDTTCTGPEHVYTSAGVYAVTVSVTDKDGGVGSAAATMYMVIYDPSAGFVTGGGWIDSPPGAYPAEPDLGGRANFGFLSRYRRGQSQPEGNTGFYFRAGGLDFHATSYDWLVVAGPHAKYKGSGTINNGGDYGFMLTATDEDMPGGGDADLFRIKIWEKDAEETVVYDNQIGADDDGYAGTVLGGGQIKIHTGGAAKQGPADPGDDPDVAAATVIPTAYALLGSIPNPFNPSTTIRFDLPEVASVRLVVYDTMGRAVARLVEGELPAGEHRVTFDGSGLPSGRYFYRLEAGSYSATRAMTLTK